MTRLRVSLRIAAALLVLACSEADESPTVTPRQPLDVILVTWDTVRWDHVGMSAEEEAGSKTGSSHTPTWDRFAREGVVFTEARTPAPVTLPAHASILTGLIPPHHGARDNGIFKLRETVSTLAEEFGRAGYMSAALVSAEVLHPRHGLDRGFDHYDYFVHRAEGFRTVPERRADKTVDSAVAWLARPPMDRPLFLWVTSTTLTASGMRRRPGATATIRTALRSPSRMPRRGGFSTFSRDWADCGVRWS